MLLGVTAAVWGCILKEAGTRMAGWLARRMCYAGEGSRTCKATPGMPPARLGPDPYLRLRLVPYCAGGFNPQFLPKLEGIASLFGRLPVTASWVLHIMCVNLFSARWCLLDGRCGPQALHDQYGAMGALILHGGRRVLRVLSGLS